MKSQMKIMIMCGGRGSRLRQLTENIPKPLIKLNSKTILELKIEQYLSQGFNDFILCIGYKGNLIRQAVSGMHHRTKVSYSDSGEDVGILERIHLARDLFEDQVLMTYGDTFTDLCLSELIETHQKNNNEITIVAAPFKNPFGLVEYDQNHKMISFKEKPVLKYYIGYAVINKSALNYVPAEVLRMPDGEGLVMFYKTLMAMKKVGVYYYSGLQVTFNTESELKVARHKIARFYTAIEENNG